MKPSVRLPWEKQVVQDLAGALLWIACIALAVKYVPWEALVFVIVVGGIARFMGRDEVV